MYALARGKTICQTLENDAPQHQKISSMSPENILHFPPLDAPYPCDGAYFPMLCSIFSDAMQHIF